MTTDVKKTTETLNRLLRGEISAVDAYDIAMDSIDVGKRDVPMSCRESHALRCQLLRDRIRLLGDYPAETPGVWGAVTATLTSGATILGQSRIVALLEEGEDHGLKEYLEALEDPEVDHTTQTWIRDRLYADQLNTHRMMSDLQKSMAA